MGTTAQKGAYLNQTKSLLKDKINALGGSIDDETTFRKYANQLDGIYDAIPKTEYQSGSKVNLGKTIKGKLDFAKEYQAVEYIESSGTQYIDTGVNADSTLKIDMDIAFTSQGTANFTNTFGAIISGGAQRLHFAPSGANSIAMAYANNLNATLFSKFYTTRFNTIADFINKTVVTNVEGETISSSLTNDNPFNLNINFWLFRRNGDNPEYAYFCYMRVYSFKLYSSNVLVRDFIPCYRLSDGTTGLYDKVESKFYTNLGTGEFTKGADVGSGFDEIVGIGQSSQDSTQGYNLSNFNTDSQNGISYNINTIKIVNPTSFNYADNWNLKNDSSLSGSTYSIYMCVNGTKASGVTIELNIGKTGNGYAFQKLLSSNTTNFNNDISVGTITLGENEVFTSFNTYLSQSVTANLEVKVMVVKGSYTTSTIPNFEPYTNGASPSPNWKQEVKGVAGKNKFDIGTSLDDYFQTNTNGTKPGSWTVNAVTATIEENKLTIDTYNSSGWNWLSKWVELEPNTDYTISGTNTSVLKIIGFNSNELQAQGTQVVQKAPNASDSVKTFNSGDYKYYCLSCFPEATGKYFENIQIEEGTTFTPYRSFNTVDGTIHGKQLIPFPFSDSDVQDRNGVNWNVNSNGTINASGTANSSSSIFYLANGDDDLYLEPGNYKISTNLFTDANGFSIQAIQIINGSYGAVYWNDMVLTERTRLRVRIIAKPNATVNVQNAYMMIEPGTTATPFEPYITPETYQFSLGDYEFHGIGNYKDKILCDLENEKVYKLKEFTKVYLKDLAWSYNSPDNRVLTSGLERMIKKTLDNNEVGNIRCNVGQPTSVNNLIASSDRSMVAVSSLGYISYKTPSFSSLTEYTNMFASTNAYIVVQIKEPEHEEITGTLKDQVIAWCKAHSTNETTIIEMDGDLPLLIEVRGLKGAA